jgi:thiol-disulfide isomerase/thioredoxin
MKHLAAILICWASMTVALFAGADNLVRVETPGGFCSGVCVGPQLVLTANHCNPSQQTVVVTRSGQRVSVTRVVRRIRRGDHTVGLVLAESIDTEPATLATDLPEPGEAIESYGFAHGGPLKRYQGRSQSTRWRNQIGGASLLKSSVISEQGTSGGGVFDADDELVAIVSGMDLQSTYSMTDVQQCLQAVAAKKTTLVAFVTSGCPPCMAFRRDHAAGAFAKLDVRIVSYDGRTGTWSDPALYKEALPALRQSGNRLAFPCFWIRGRADAASIRIGYRESRGLLQFVAAVIDTIIGGIIGRPPQAEFPALASADGETAPPPVPDEPATTEEGITEEFRRPAPSVDEIKSQVRDLRELVALISDDIAAFRDAGVIGKLRRIDDLKADKKAAVEQIGELRSTVEDLKANPTGFLVSLVGGLLAGLLKRRLKP